MSLTCVKQQRDAAKYDIRKIQSVFILDSKICDFIVKCFQYRRQTTQSVFDSALYLLLFAVELYHNTCI